MSSRYFDDDGTPVRCYKCGCDDMKADNEVYICSNCSCLLAVKVDDTVTTSTGINTTEREEKNDIHTRKSSKC